MQGEMTNKFRALASLSHFKRNLIEQLIVFSQIGLTTAGKVINSLFIKNLIKMAERKFFEPLSAKWVKTSLTVLQLPLKFMK